MYPCKPHLTITWKINEEMCFENLIMPMQTENLVTDYVQINFEVFAFPLLTSQHHYCMCPLIINTIAVVQLHVQMYHIFSTSTRFYP